MNKNKNIDRLFQEKLKSLDTKPSDKVWTVIEAKLKKQPKRIFPFWWFYSGIAAALILGFVLFPFSKDENTNENNIRHIEIITSSPENKIEEKIDKEVDLNFPSKENKDTKEVIVTTEKPVIKSKKFTKKKVYAIAKNKNLASEKKETETNLALYNSANITEKESTLDSKKAMKKIFKSEKNKELLLKPKKDFLAVVAEKDSLKIPSNTSKKWAISPSFAVLNANSFSNNSALDANLNASEMSGKNTYSYGIKVAYEINNKWTIQSGIHLQKMGYATKNLEVSASLSSQNLSNITSDAPLAFNVPNNVPKTVDLRSSFAVVASEQGDLNQVFGYIEIPLELKYNMTNSSKFKTEIVTGFSSLFLNQNSINLISNSFSGKIGKANNLNNINFSGNLGLDFNYAIDKNLFLNLNPMFKAQFNTFSKNSNGFQPYFLAIYTGIKYQF